MNKQSLKGERGKKDQGKEERDGAAGRFWRTTDERKKYKNLGQAVEESWQIQVNKRFEETGNEAVA